MNIELDRYQGGSDSYTDSEPFEEEIFYDVRKDDRFCAQCGQDHRSKQQFKDVKTSIEHIPKLFPLIKNMSEISTDSRIYDTNYTQPLTCRLCRAAIIVEVTTNIYNLDLYVEDQKVEHRHPADPETLCNVLERVATEVRLLDKFDPHDYVYL